MLNKRFCAVAMTAAMTAALLAGCGSDSSSEASTESATQSTTEASAEAATEAAEETYAADAYLSGINAADYVQLPDYSSIDVTLTEDRQEVTDEDVEAYIQSALQADQELVEITDRDVAEDGDVVNIDYVGKLNGEAFSGGTDEDCDLELGSGVFIEGFEDGVVGMKVGETKVLTLTFPENYSSTDLAGKETTFDVTLNKIQEYQVPELTDAWVAEQEIDDVTTVDEYRDYVRENLENSAEEDYLNNLDSAITDYMFNNATWLQEPPTAMVDRLYDTVVGNYENYANYYGVDLATFMSAIGYDADTYEETLREDSTKNAKMYIIYKAVADEQGLTVTDDELEESAADMAASYGYEDTETFLNDVGQTQVQEYLILNRALVALENNTNVTIEAAEDDAEDAAEASSEASTEAATEDAEEASTEAATETAEEASTKASK